MAVTFSPSVEAKVLRGPVGVPDYLGADARSLTRGATDLVDPLGAFGRRLEVEEDVVRLRPERIGRSQERSPRSHAGRRRHLMEPRERTRHRRADGRLVGVPELSVVEPLLPQGEPLAAEWPRRSEPFVGERRLDELDVVEVRLVREECVQLDRDPRPVATTDAEERADARAEEEHLVCLGLEAVDPRADRGRVEGPQQILHDRRARMTFEERVDAVHLAADLRRFRVPPTRVT